MRDPMKAKQLIMPAFVALMALVRSADAAVIFPVTSPSPYDWATANVTQSGTILTISLREALGNPSTAQMLSGFELFFDTPPTAITNLTQAGQLVNLADSGVGTPIAGAPTNWGDGLNGNTFILETVGAFAVSDQSYDMITFETDFDSSGDGSNFVKFSPFISHTGTFTVQLPAGYDALSHITAARFQFGTSPGFVVVPEPSTWALMLLGFGGIGGLLRSARRQSVRAGA
jgi:hypothetical protein